MTGTFPKNAGSTSPGGSQKARALCGNPRRSFHFFGPSGFPLASHGCQGRFPGFTEFVRNRTETRIKLKVARGQVARYEPDDSELLPRRAAGRVLAGNSGGRAAPQEFAPKLPPQRKNRCRRFRQIFPGSHGNPKKSEGPGCTGCPFRFFPVRPWIPLRNPRSWRVLATANRRDCLVRN